MTGPTKIPGVLLEDLEPGDLVLKGATSGTIKLDATAVAGANTITLPALTGTVALTSQIINTFKPADQTITAGGQLTLIHGLASLPNFFSIALVCTTAEFGYSIGDIACPISGQDGFSDKGVTIVLPNTTDVLIIYGVNAKTFALKDKSTNVKVELTNSSWDLRLVAAFV